MRSVICGVHTILLLSNMSATGEAEEEMMIDNHVILSAHQIYNIASMETVNVGDDNLLGIRVYLRSVSTVYD